MPPAVDVDLPQLACRLCCDPFRVDVHHDALAAETPGRLANELGIAAGGRIDRYLVAPGLQQGADVVHRANSAADRKRHEYHFGRAADHVKDDFTPLVAGGDVEEDQFVGPLLLIPCRHLDGIAGIAEIKEVCSLDHPAPAYVEAWNHPLRQH